MNVFYVEKIVPYQPLILSPEESKHLIRVLRKAKGDIVQVTNGRSEMYEAVINNDNYKTGCELLLTAKLENTKETYYSHIAISPTKNLDRLEWFVEKATELGVHQITPLICARTEKGNVKKDRLEKIALAAMKQSGRAWLPIISEAVEFDTFINTVQQEDQKFVAYCEHLYEKKSPPHLSNQLKRGSRYTVLIGPEGDFTKEEVQQALQKGFENVSLGGNRLRTETAALYACSCVYTCNKN
ncbi:MAG: 16S rRNA (uracil(1498)-N(3))-methyltransferase [Bacteroidetes bacterium]|nr:16S rRNA (uracil(1498)-N(3))-methyltransferase [Bacteroidota bacterium]